jgi:CW-type Zinc Finger
VPLGSPILDFLVTGDDFNINFILRTLGIAERLTQQSDGLLSSVDHGRPAQAVSNWVQCENPDCQKWRKVPWHVDIDMISEKFFCKDNVWNPSSASCDAPEDVWDESTDARVDANGSAYSAEPTVTPEVEKSDANPVTTFKLNDFKLGGKSLTRCEKFGFNHSLKLLFVSEIRCPPC